MATCWQKASLDFPVCRHFPGCWYWVSFFGFGWPENAPVETIKSTTSQLTVAWPKHEGTPETKTAKKTITTSHSLRKKEKHLHGSTQPNKANRGRHPALLGELLAIQIEITCFPNDVFFWHIVCETQKVNQVVELSLSVWLPQKEAIYYDTEDSFLLMFAFRIIQFSKFGFWYLVIGLPKKLSHTAMFSSFQLPLLEAWHEESLSAALAMRQITNRIVIATGCRWREIDLSLIRFEISAGQQTYTQAVKQ